jgi:Uma2 family endonuclease
VSAIPQAYRLGYADWLRLPDDSRLCELLEGELLLAPPPSIAHQRASRNLELRLAEYLRRTGAGEVLDAPVGVRLAEDTVLEPDLVVVLSAHADRVGDQAIEGVPDLVVEVLSPGTAQRDLGRKRDLYERHGVPEYWIVDPEARTIEVLALASGLYDRAGLYGTGDVLRSAVLPAFELPVGEVFARC